MTGMRLHLESAASYECVEEVASFVATDASGSFGLMPGHEPLATVLEFGLSRFRVGEAPWRYIAAPGAVLLAEGDEIHFSTRRCVVGGDLDALRRVLDEQLSAEEEAQKEVKSSVRKLEQEMLKKLWQLGRGDGETP